MCYRVHKNLVVEKHEAGSTAAASQVPVAVPNLFTGERAADIESRFLPDAQPVSLDRRIDLADFLCELICFCAIHTVFVSHITGNRTRLNRQEVLPRRV